MGEKDCKRLSSEFSGVFIHSDKKLRHKYLLNSVFCSPSILQKVRKRGKSKRIFFPQNFEIIIENHLIVHSQFHIESILNF